MCAETEDLAGGWNESLKLPRVCAVGTWGSASVLYVGHGAFLMKHVFCF